jgi:hypothetical protein
MVEDQQRYNRGLSITPNLSSAAGGSNEMMRLSDIKNPNVMRSTKSKMGRNILSTE